MTKYEEFYGSKVLLKGSGKQRTTNCPFCGHKNDLSINIETGQCKCFQCDFEGDTFDFLERLEGIEFKEVKKELMKYGIEPITEKQELGVLKERKFLSEIIEGEMLDYAKKCASNVPSHVISYLKETRGLKDEIVNRYQIGFCSKHPNYQKDEYERLSIPIRRNGKVINIRFHAIGKVKDGGYKTLPYCSDLPEATSLFPEEQLKNDVVYIVEGELDALCAISHGLSAVSATGGAGSWKEEWTPLFEEKKVRVIYDCDTKGREGARKVAAILSSVANEVKVIDLGLNDKEDLTDWFVEYDKTKEELEELVPEAKVVEVAENATAHREKIKQKTTTKKQTKTLVSGLVHLIKEDGVVKYLLKGDDGIRIEERVVLNGVAFRPKQDLPIKMLGPDILHETRSIDYGQLLEKVISFIKNYLEIPSDSHYLLLALWVLHTYTIDKFNSTPLLYFYGVKETGKSRAGEVLGELAFMCERLTSPTEATLFRGADYFKTSLVIDEIKLWGPQGNQEVARLINSRYKRGIKVPRVNTNKQGEDQIEYYDVFGPLVICTTESIPDTIESRCIVFLMQRNSRVEVETLIDEERARQLRNQLTLFRADYFDKTLPQTDQVARRRLNEIMMPLYQVLMVIAPKREGEFKETVKKIEKAKEEEEGMSLEAEIVEAIIKYREKTSENTFLTTELQDRLNKDRNDGEKLSGRLVGMRVKRLGFEKARLTNGKRGFKINTELLKTLALRFEIDFDTMENL